MLRTTGASMKGYYAAPLLLLLLYLACATQLGSATNFPPPSPDLRPPPPRVVKPPLTFNLTSPDKEDAKYNIQQVITGFHLNGSEGGRGEGKGPGGARGRPFRTGRMRKRGARARLSTSVGGMHSDVHATQLLGLLPCHAHACSSQGMQGDGRILCMLWCAWQVQEGPVVHRVAA